MLGRNLTEVCALWQVPTNEPIDVLIRSPLPGCIGAGKVASDSKFGRERLMFGILGPIVQRKRLAAFGRQLLESINDRPIGLVSALPGKFGDQDKAALAFYQGVESCFALSGDQAVAFPVAGMAATLNGFRSCLDRNPVGNLGFSHFSADALVLSFLVSSAQQLDHLQPIRGLGMIDVLIDGLVVDRLSWMIDPDSPGDLLRGPSLSKAVFHILPDEIIFQALVFVGLRFSLTGPSMCPAGNITSPFWREVAFELSRDRAFVPAYCFCNIAEAGTS